jgi:hypothetical protein|nr:MAG TPA: hypothetical protein [Caudoviricetes sp.]
MGITKLKDIDASGLSELVGLYVEVVSDGD